VDGEGLAPLMDGQLSHHHDLKVEVADSARNKTRSANGAVGAARIKYFLFT